jgi:hypothetical protein
LLRILIQKWQKFLDGFLAYTGNLFCVEITERNEVAYFSAFDIFYGVMVPNCLFFQLEELGETVHNCARRKADCLDLTVKKNFS